MRYRARLWGLAGRWSHAGAGADGSVRHDVVTFEKEEARGMETKAVIIGDPN